MKKHILMVCPYFYPEGSGLENYVLQLSRQLVTRGHNVTVATASLRAQRDTVDTIDGIRVHRFTTNTVVSATPIRFSLPFRLLQLTRQNKFDLIHAHTPVPFFADMAGLVSQMRNLPFMVTYHASSLKKGVLWIDTIASAYTPIQYLTLRRAKHIVAVAGNIRDGILRQWKQKVSVITPGADLEVFNTRSAWPRDPNKVVFAGSIKKATRWKGLETLIRAIQISARSCPDITLYVAGDGDDMARYKSLVDELGIQKRVIFLGMLDHQALSKEYQTARAVVIPTTSAAEGCPTIMFEAMASGATLIASRIAGIPYIIKDQQNGCLVDPGNATELSNTISSIVNQPEHADHLGRTGQKMVESSYSWESICQQYIHIYETIS